MKALPASVWKQRPIKFETLKNIGLDPKKFSTCSVPGNGNVGCAKWPQCKIKDRFENPNPRRVGIQILKRSPGGKVRAVNQIVDCISIPVITDQAVLNKGGYRIVAKEGESIKLRVSEKAATIEPGSVLPKIVKSIKLVKVEPYDDKPEDLMQDEIDATALQAFSQEKDEENILDLSRTAATNTQS